jgi:hypothetical protein
MKLHYEGVYFDKNITEQCIEFAMPLPHFQEEIVWAPEIIVTYEIKKFSEE